MSKRFIKKKVLLDVSAIFVTPTELWWRFAVGGGWMEER